MMHELNEEQNEDELGSAKNDFFKTNIYLSDNYKLQLQEDF